MVVVIITVAVTVTVVIAVAVTTAIAAFATVVITITIAVAVAVIIVVPVLLPFGFDTFGAAGQGGAAFLSCWNASVSTTSGTTTLMTLRTMHRAFIYV